MGKRQSARDRRIARQRARLRTAPEASTITALLGEAKTTYESDITSADAAAKSAIHFANKAEKPVREVYDAARGATDAARQDVEAAFGKLGGAADPFRAATTREREGATRRLELAGANALNELTQRKLEAKAGGQYARTQAGTEFNKTVGTLRQRLLDLGVRRGDIAGSELAAIQETRDKNQVPIDVANIGAKSREDIAADKLAAADKKKKAKSQVTQTPDKHSVWQSDITSIIDAAGSYGKGLSRAALKTKLAQGRESQTVLVDKDGNPLGEGLSGREKVQKGAKKVTLPAKPKFAPDLRMSAALDLYLTGRLGRETKRRLHAAGFSIRNLGLAQAPMNSTERKIRAGTLAGPPAPR